jgi:Zn-dependent protease with chaperone function
VCAAISSLSDIETLRNICLAIGWLLTLAAVVPSSFWSAWEQVTKGKGRCVEDPDTVIPEWQQFCHSMGIEKSIKMKVFANLRNAYTKGTTIEIGQPVLDSLNSVSIKGVFAHELVHIKRNHTLKKERLLFGVLLAAILLSGVLYSFSPLGPSLFTCSALLILIGFIG